MPVQIAPAGATIEPRVFCGVLRLPVCRGRKNGKEEARRTEKQGFPDSSGWNAGAPGRARWRMAVLLA